MGGEPGGPGAYTQNEVFHISITSDFRLKILSKSFLSHYKTTGKTNF